MAKKEKPVTKLWGDLTQWLEEASRVVGKEAGDMTLKGRLKLEMFDLNRMLKDSFTTLGDTVFQEVFLKKNENWQTGKKVTTTVRKIKSIQTKLKKKEKEYKKVGKTPTKKKSKKR